MIPIELMYAIWGIGQLLLINLSAFVFYGTLHHFEFPFFEQYKAFDEPSPWYKDKEAWRVQLLHTIKIVSFNITILTPYFSLVHYIHGVPLALDFSVEGLPCVS